MYIFFTLVSGLLFLSFFAVWWRKLNLRNLFLKRNGILFVKRLRKESIVPEYKSNGAAGFDLFACCPEGDISIEPGQTVKIPTGCAFAFPMRYEVQIRSRSGLAANGVVVANAPGTVDSDYRGDVGVLLENKSKDPFTVTHAMRVAQAVLAPVLKAQILSCQSFPVCFGIGRGGGFGSTGLY